jgi:hypothetical protein
LVLRNHCQELFLYEQVRIKNYLITPLTLKHYLNNLLKAFRKALSDLYNNYRF